MKIFAVSAVAASLLLAPAAPARAELISIAILSTIGIDLVAGSAAAAIAGFALTATPSVGRSLHGRYLR